MYENIALYFCHATQFQYVLKCIYWSGFLVWKPTLSMVSSWSVLFSQPVVTVPLVDSCGAHLSALCWRSSTPAHCQGQVPCLRVPHLLAIICHFSVDVSTPAVCKVCMKSAVFFLLQLSSTSRRLPCEIKQRGTFCRWTQSHPPQMIALNWFYYMVC